MPDPPGIPSALGIEAVEVIESGGPNLTIRVTGRWARHRRLAWRGRPVLLVEEGAQRHRFTAIPEPPSVSGAAPGTWQVSFAVPASLSDQLAGRTWLQVGSTVVPLPPVARPEGRGITRPGPPREPALRSERQPPAVADADRVRLLTELEQADRLRRLAEQRAHAEESLRIDLEEMIAERDRELADHHAVLAELAAAEEQLRLAREQEPPPGETAGPPDRARAIELRRELALSRRALSPAAARPATAKRPQSSAAVTELERKLIAGHGSGGARLGAVLTELEQRLAEQRVAASERESPVTELREELGRLAIAVEQEVEAREATERALAEQQRRTASAARTVAELRMIVAGLRGMIAGSPLPRGGAGEPVGAVDGARGVEAAGVVEAPGAVEAAGVVDAAGAVGPLTPAGIEPGRLDAALTRLRQARPSAADPVAADAEGTAVWLRPTLARLVKRDPEAAGELLALFAPGVASDLAPEALARLVTAGALRWRLGGARHRSSAAAQLRRFVREPHAFGRLATGLGPMQALTLVAAMVDPGWTAGHRFAVGHRGAGVETYLRIRDGRPPTVATVPPLGPVATTIHCQPDELVALLAGRWPADARLSGSRQPVELIQGWVGRAQGI